MSNEIKIEKIKGPYKTVLKNGKNIFYANYENDLGEKTTKNFSTEEDAVKFVKECREKIKKDRIDSEKLPDFDGSPTWFLNIIADLTKKYKETGGKAYKEKLRVISQASKYAKALIDYSKLREQVEEIKKQLSDMTRADKHGIRIAGTNKGNKDNT